MTRHRLDPEASAGMDTHRRVAELIDPPSGAYVIDAGAGHGAFTERLVAAGYRAVAAEFKRENYWCTLAPQLICDLERGLPFATGSAEGVAAIEILEHLERPFLLIREAARCLRMRGWLALTTPNVLSLTSRLEFLVRGHHRGFSDSDYYGNGHISPLSVIDLARIGDRAGFRVESVTYNVGRLPIPKVYARVTLRHSRFRKPLLGESLIMVLRKVAPPRTDIYRG